MIYVPIVSVNITLHIQYSERKNSYEKVFTDCIVIRRERGASAEAPPPSNDAGLCCQSHGFDPSWYLVFHFSNLISPPRIRRSVLHILYRPHTLWPLNTKCRDSDIHNHLESSPISSLPRSDMDRLSQLISPSIARTNCLSLCIYTIY